MNVHPVWSIVAAALVFCCAPLGQAQSRYDRHVIFDNALVDGPYYHSEIFSVAPSALDGATGKIPVTSERFVSAPNSLRLKWTSAEGGDWRATILVPTRYARQFDFAGDTLSFWCYSDVELNEENSPRVYVQDPNKLGSPAVTLVKGSERLPARQWVRIRVPIAKLIEEGKGTDPAKCNIRKLLSVSFMQGLDDGRQHTLYIDDVQIVDGNLDDTVAPAAPTRVVVRGFERHFDVGWAASPAEDVLAYRIYRSIDGKVFQPVGTQQGALLRAVDFFGEPGSRAFYKVSAVDLAGNESPLSEAASAQTRSMTDDELLDMVQEGCFRYYWEAAHPNAGLAPEVLPGDPNLIATGGNGFGIMALLVATERKFITREQAVDRMLRIVRFLAAADRHHGVWPHFLDGRTGRTVAFFGDYDNGGDLVESAFVMQGLLAARTYFAGEDTGEREIRDTITRLWREMEWDWYRQKPDSDVLYWHWSPTHGFKINHALIGFNETMIVYLLAIASPTHPVPASLYHTGWAGRSETHVRYRQSWGRTKDGDQYVNGKSYYGIKLDVGVGNGAELFFTHFSFMGFDPRGIRDQYTNYFENNRAITLINRAYCIENPRKFAGYGPDCWGRSAGIHSGGGRAWPRDDNGTINCMAALSSMPYTPAESMAALKHFYRVLGPKAWGVFGFYDGFNESQAWYEMNYMALNQAPIVVMIENHRTGLVWRKFMENTEVAPALKAIGFTPAR
jgi:exo beta-1,2-glucooligosaccharide sophorohydrolase (non-reducing end)